MNTEKRYRKYSRSITSLLPSKLFVQTKVLPVGLPEPGIDQRLVLVQWDLRLNNSTDKDPCTNLKTYTAMPPPKWRQE